MDPSLPAKQKSMKDDFKLIEMTPHVLTAQIGSNDQHDNKKQPKGISYLFFVLFILPVLFSGIYLLGIASDQYMSEAEFMVRTPSTAGGLGSLVQGQSISRSTDETQAVSAYMKSRDMAQKLLNQDSLRNIYHRPEADVLSRFPNMFTPDNFERLFEHFRNATSVDVNEGTGITTMRVFTYRAKDSQDIATAMLKHAEDLVNSLNIRAYEDRLAYSYRIVEKAQAEVVRVEVAMTSFRNSKKVVDPTRESTSALELIGKETTEIAQLESILKQQIALTPNNPSIQSLKQRIASNKEVVESMRRKVVGGADSISTNMADYERLQLERQLMARELESAFVNLDKARQEAETPHVYLVHLTEPNLVDVAEYPRRFLWLGIIAALSFAVWMIVRFAVDSIKEHHA